MIAQLALNGIVTGLIVALPALALTLTFSILKFPNFAIGAMITFGAYLAWVLNSVLGMPLIAAGIGAMGGLALASVLCERLVFRKLRDRDGITLLVASIGVAFILENICRFFFGNEARSLDVAVARPIRWMGLRVNHEQLDAVIVVLTCLAILYVVLRHTSLGRGMRAVADNPSLAAARGVERDKITILTWIMASGITAIAAILMSLDRAVDPQMGWNYQISIFAAAILGGLGSLPGAFLGALLIGLAEELSVLVIPSNYRQSVGFFVILLLLLVRPQGLFGKKVAKK